MNSKFDVLYMDIAQRISEMSYSTRSKVGALIVKNKNIIAFGWNGTPYGFDNCCEDENGKTKNEVIHAEENAIAKAANIGISISGSVMYTTLSPCIGCSKLIIQSGISEVIYLEEYRINDAISFLEKCHVKIRKF
jgi:dCMP deaminase